MPANIAVNWRSDSTQARRDMQQIEGSADSVDKKSKRSFKNFANSANLFIGAVAASVAVKVVADLATLGDEMRLIEQTADSVFGESSEAAAAFADSIRRDLGTGQIATLGLITDMGALAVSFGLAGDEALLLAEDHLALVRDITLTNTAGLDAEDVAQRLQKAYVGERDSLDALGITIKQSDVNTRLLSEGKEDLTGNALKVAEAMATMDLATEQYAARAAGLTGDLLDQRLAQNELNSEYSTAKEEVGKLASDLKGVLAVAILTDINRVRRFIGWLKDLGRVTQIAVKNMIAAWKRLLGPIQDVGRTISGVVSQVRNFSIGNITSSVRGLVGFDQGGIVPGPRGSARLVLAHGGETILPTHRRSQLTMQGGGGSGATFNVNVTAPPFTDPGAIGSAVVEALRSYERRNLSRSFGLGEL